MYQRLLVAVDGSEQSDEALDHAVALVEKFGSELVLLTVARVPPFLGDESFDPKAYTKYQESELELCHNILKDVEEMVRTKHPNLNVRTILREGRPSAIIVDVAEKEGCDMIIVGSRGMGGITGLVLGSTSHRVVDSCIKPVMIIK